MMMLSRVFSLVVSTGCCAWTNSAVNKKADDNNFLPIIAREVQKYGVIRISTLMGVFCRLRLLLESFRKMYTAGFRILPVDRSYLDLTGAGADGFFPLIRGFFLDRMKC